MAQEIKNVQAPVIGDPNGPRDGQAWSRPASEELKEAVVAEAKDLDIDVSSILDITGLTPSDIVDTLFMKIADGKIYKPKWKLELTRFLPKEIVRLGNNEYKYHDLEGHSDDLAIDADNTMDDFNGSYQTELAEVFRLDTKFHKKVKLPELVLSNAWLAAQGMIEFVQIQTEEMSYAVERRWENLAWRKVFNNATAIEVPAGSDPIEFNRALTRQMKEYDTTSDEHLGIGNNGVITIDTVSGTKTVQPDLYFDPKEWVLFVDTDQWNDIVYENDAQWYNYAATKMEWGEVRAISFTKYKGFKAIKKAKTDGTADDTVNIAEEVQIPAGLKMVAMPKDAIVLLEQYDYTQTLKGRGPWSITHNHKKIDAYYVKTMPIITVVEAADVPAGEAYTDEEVENFTAEENKEAAISVIATASKKELLEIIKVQGLKVPNAAKMVKEDLAKALTKIVEEA